MSPMEELLAFLYTSNEGRGENRSKKEARTVRVREAEQALEARVAGQTATLRAEVLRFFSQIIKL